MYGKWLYKEIGTEYGACMVEIYRKNYTGESIEIGALAANSLSIALENLGSITDPIGKSVCSFSIIDTNQVEYDDFFTPDATALKVVVSTRVGSGAYVTRWSGYVTPDFFAENLSYRTPISISARDNIGYLNDVDFDLTATTITVRELIQSAFKRIAEDYPMSLSFVTQKQTAEGILAIDATISTTILREMSWGEALETILHDLGLQMRWVDNNTIAVLDLSQIPEYYTTQGFNFIDASGYREIAPAWRELSQEQNYGVRENFFEGWLREDNITFVKTENIRIPLSMGGVTGLVPMRYYTPNNWGVAGNTFAINPKDYVYFGTYGQMAQPFGERIFFTGVEKDATNIANNYMSYRQDVYASNRPIRITFKAFTSVMATGGIGNNDALLAYDPANRFMDFATGDTLQLGLKVNLLLHVGTRTYILGQNWEEVNGAETNSLYFVLPKIGQVDGSSVTPNEEEITIDVNTIPNDGVLELRIYGFTIHNKTNLQEDAGSATYDWLRMVSYINEVKYTYNIDNPDTGRYSQVEVNKQHNIKDTQSYTFGQIPVEGGAVNAFAGGLYKADGNELVGFQRNADATNYNLLELVGREIIHFNKKNYNRLSGTIKNLNKEPLMFNRLFVREGKKYAPYNYSLNVISNEMNITSMQEVEPYTTANFSEVHSEVSTGGSTVSGGNNQVLQYSAEVGNAKRLYELQTISENEKPDAYVLVDGAGYPEARKLKLTDIAGLDEKALEQYLVQYKYLQEADLTPFIQDFEKLEEAVNPLFGYFDANGNANNALKLGGHTADYFATANAVNTLATNLNSLASRVSINEQGIATNKNNIATLVEQVDGLADDVEILKGYWYIDDDGNLHTTHNLVVDGGGAFGKGSGGGGDVPSGGGIDETQLWNILGTSGTRTIHSSHIPDLSGRYLSVSGGTIENSSFGYHLSLIRPNSSKAVGIHFGNSIDGNLGYIGVGGSGNDFGIVPFYRDISNNYHTLLHSGNYSSYALPLSGGKIYNTNYGALDISRANGAGYSAIKYSNDGGLLGYIGVGGSGSEFPFQPTFYDGTNSYGIIHSGNIGSYAPIYNANGNILIGATTDGGHKLRVQGSSYVTGEGIFGGIISANSGILSRNELSFRNNAVIQSYSLPLQINPQGNNVLIGKTSDSGYKLQVNGSVSLSGIQFDGGESMDTYGNFKFAADSGYWHIDKPDASLLFSVWRATGDVQISNSTSDLGYKLYVGGTSYFNGSLSANAGIAIIGGDLGLGAASNGYKFYLKDTTTNSNAIYLETTNTSGEASIFYKAGNTSYQWAAGIACGLAGQNVWSMYSVSAGKWIFAAKATGVDINGNLTVTGGGAFGSDIRYKDITSYRQLDLETIANAPLFTFKWTDREDKMVHLGTSAQYWLETQAKDAVNITNPKFFHLDYGALGVGIGISVAKETIKVKSRVEILEERVEMSEKRVNQLEQELAQYRRA